MAEITGAKPDKSFLAEKLGPVVAQYDYRDETGRVLYQKRLRNELGEILPAFAPYQDTLQGIVVESTYNWYWLVDGLMAAGYRVHLANTTAIEQ